MNTPKRKRDKEQQEEEEKSEKKRRIDSECNEEGKLLFELYETEKSPIFLLLAAWMGHAPAEYEVGNQMLENEHQQSHGFEWIHKAALQGFPEAQYEMGFKYRYAEGNVKEAIEWFEKAANQGSVGAQYELARMYRYGKGVSSDFEKALLWFQKAADRNHAFAQFELANMYDEGIGVAKNPCLAFCFMEKSLTNGNKHALCSLGFYYDTGFGTTKNEDKALECFETGAKLGNINCQFNAGVTYKDRKQFVKAQEWLEKAACSDDVGAQHELGKLYARNECLDVSKSVYWLTKAADQNFIRAQYDLGLHYLKQHQTKSEAIIWLEKAAEQNDIQSLVKLASLFQKKEPLKCEFYLRKAIALGDVRSNYQLAKLLLKHPETDKHLEALDCLEMCLSSHAELSYMRVYELITNPEKGPSVCKTYDIPDYFFSAMDGILSEINSVSARQLSTLVAQMFLYMRQQKMKNGKEIENLQNTITELELRPPHLGGPAFEQAKSNFERLSSSS